MEQKLTALPRVVFLSSGGILGDTVFKRLIESGRFDVAGVVRSRRVLLRDAGFLRGAAACFARCGVIYTVYIWLITTFAEALGWLTSHGSITWRAKRHGIPVLHTRNINDTAGLAFLERLGPQALISAHFDQPLLPLLCDGQKYCAVNLHPSLLPHDQGLEPVLHALCEGRKDMGVTLHRTAEKLDCGNILITRRLSCSQKHSVLGFMSELMALGGDMLVEQAAQIAIAGNGIPQEVGGNYNSWPDGRLIGRLYRLGHHLIRPQDAKLFLNHT